MRFIASLALIVVMAFSMATVAQAKPRAAVGSGVAAKACKAERAADPAAFKTKYANAKGKRAFGRCVSLHVRAARKTCRTERKADPAAFKTKYANSKGNHAFKRCVRQHADDPVVVPA